MKKNQYSQSRKGFTLMEIMISLGLLIMISSLVFFSFNSLNNKQSLDKQIDFIKSSINQTRLSAINSKNTSNQSISFSTTSLVIENINFLLDTNITLVSYTTGTTTINFNRLSGFPSATGTIVYQLKNGNDVLATSSIIINNIGIIE